MALNQYAPTRTLVDALAKAGWGELRSEWRGVREVLRALAVMADPRTGNVKATVADVADRAGYASTNDSKHARRCLGILASAGLIEWTPGGIQAGKPAPSRFVVLKRELLALVFGARAWHDELLARRRAQVAQRLAGLRVAWIKRRSRYRPLSDRPDTVSGLTSQERSRPGPNSRPGPTPTDKPPHPPPQPATAEQLARLRAALAGQLGESGT